MNVINVSLRGALINSLQKKAIFEIKEELRDVRLIFPYKKKYLIAHIKRVSIKRIKKHPLSQQYIYSLHFTRIEKNEKKILTKIICQLERKFLQKRHRIYE